MSWSRQLAMDPFGYGRAQGAWRRMLLAVCLGAALGAGVAVGSVQAATLEGQHFDDTIVLASHKLQLNGLGLRGVAWVKAFVAGLYVSSPSRDAAQLLAESGPRRLRLKVMVQAPSSELSKSLLRRVRRHETPEAQEALGERLSAFTQQLDGMGQLEPGDVVDMDYVPGKGVVLARNGNAVGKPLLGADLYRAVLQVFVGEHSIDPVMRQGLLGGRS